MNNQKFDKPLNEWTEEQVPVRKVKYNPDTKQIITTTELETVKTMYIDAPLEKHRCKDGEHVFKCVDNGRYIFSCLNCPYSRKVYPITYSFIDGKLISKITGKAV
jgi:hypothetical protein